MLMLLMLMLLMLDEDEPTSSSLPASQDKSEATVDDAHLPYSLTISKDNITRAAAAPHPDCQSKVSNILHRAHISCLISESRGQYRTAIRIFLHFIHILCKMRLKRGKTIFSMSPFESSEMTVFGQKFVVTATTIAK